MSKNDRLSLRLTTEDKKIIQIAAIKKGKSLNEFVVECCLKIIKEEKGNEKI